MLWHRSGMCTESARLGAAHAGPDHAHRRFTISIQLIKLLHTCVDPTAAECEGGRARRQRCAQTFAVRAITYVRASASLNSVIVHDFAARLGPLAGAKGPCRRHTQPANERGPRRTVHRAVRRSLCTRSVNRQGRWAATAPTRLVGVASDVHHCRRGRRHRSGQRLAHAMAHNALGRRCFPDPILHLSGHNGSTAADRRARAGAAVSARRRNGVRRNPQACTRRRSDLCNWRLCCRCVCRNTSQQCWMPTVERVVTGMLRHCVITKRRSVDLQIP